VDIESKDVKKKILSPRTFPNMFPSVNVMYVKLRELAAQMGIIFTPLKRV